MRSASISAFLSCALRTLSSRAISCSSASAASARDRADNAERDAWARAVLEALPAPSHN
eukprot:COSAG01_NODE_768_length_13739_cov_6.271334_3_plen_59_part_00